MIITAIERLVTLEDFQCKLAQPGPWIAGVDFPFGQSMRFLRNIGWPLEWERYVGLVSTISRSNFRAVLQDYKENRPFGDKEHRRETDVRAGAISPQKLYGVPVGLMFAEGAQRLLRSGAWLPGLKDGDRARICVEAYPGVFARKVTKNGYKSDTKSKQSHQQSLARSLLLEAISGENFIKAYGFYIVAPRAIVDDASGDELDAVICAAQAAWATKNLDHILGHLTLLHQTEGWIADPSSFDWPPPEIRSNSASNPADGGGEGARSIDGGT